MAPRAGVAYAEIVPKLAEGFAGDLQKQFTGPVEQSGSKIGSSLGKIAGLVGGAFAAKGIFDFGKSAVEAATESNKIAAQTEAVIKSTGGAAHLTAKQFGDLATAISNKTGIDDEQIQSAENLLATFTNVHDAAGKNNDVFSQATRIMTDMGAAMGTDAKSSAIQLGKALNDPVQGISALSRVGVTFTDQQKDQIKAMVASGNTMGAQKTILSELSKEFGGSAEAQATAGDKLKVIWGNVQEQLGNILIPILNKVATFLADNLPGAMAFVSDAVDHLKPVLAELTAWFSEKLPGAIVWARHTFEDLRPTLETIKDVLTTVGNIVRWVGERTIEAVGWIVENWKTVRPIVEGIAVLIAAVMIPQWIALGVAALASAATQGAAWVISQAGAIAATVVSTAQMAIQVGEWIAMGVAAMANAAVVAAAWLVSMGPIALVVGAVIGAVALIVTNWDTIKNAGLAVFDWVKDNWPLLLGILTGPIGLAVLAIVKNWDTITAAVTAVKDWIVARWGEVVGFITGLPGKISSAAAGMWDGITGAFKSAINAILSVWNGLEFKIPGFKVGPVGFDGFTLGVPDIPLLRDAGGPVTAGRPYMIGRGPELFMPSVSGGIVSTADLSKIASLVGADARRSGSEAPVVGVMHVHDARMTAADISAELGWLRRTSGR